MKVAIFLEVANDSENEGRINHLITKAIKIVRGRSIITGNQHAFSIGLPLGCTDDEQIVHIISSGLDVFSQNLEELKSKAQNHPPYVKELADLICSGEDGQDIFEILDEDNSCTCSHCSKWY